MSRSCYSEDYGDDFPGQLELFRANVDRSFNGKAGQARLKELRDALLALPKKELAFETFAELTEQGPQVCALGAWALQKMSGDLKKVQEEVGSPLGDSETAALLKKFGWPKLVVYEVVFTNDDYGEEETPAERYERVLAWVEKQIK